MLSSSYGKKGEDARPPARSRAVRKKLLLSLLSAAPLFPLRRLPRQAEQRSCIDYRFINWKHGLSSKLHSNSEDSFAASAQIKANKGGHVDVRACISTCIS